MMIFLVYWPKYFRHRSGLENAVLSDVMGFTLVLSSYFLLSHDDLRLCHRAPDGFVGQHLAAIQVDLVLNRHVLPEHADVLHPHPSSNSTIPSYDAALQPGVTLDPRAFEHSCPLDADSVLHHDPGPEGDIRPDAAVGPDLGGGVHDHVANDSGTRGQHRALLLRQTVEVETHPGEEISWLTNIHPEPIKLKAVQFSIGSLKREYFFLYTGRLDLDPVQNRRFEDIEAGIYLV